ncbi:hypothetical protein VIBNISOn1_300006 [Vibrio nigripulchritudo SOn1]|uniref:Uncharacterized protein n=1 Tax=Vibrio nigripulchritudo SOn1 TaxID=1238450 RepID=A0AAV2VSE5_9VIBR|nr:hypothetical protein VIBNISOn1_300006 [Vibrio nigripulchritudo SOn1]
MNRHKKTQVTSFHSDTYKDKDYVHQTRKLQKQTHWTNPFY